MRLRSMTAAAELAMAFPAPSHAGDGPGPFARLEPLIASFETAAQQALREAFPAPAAPAR